MPKKSDQTNSKHTDFFTKEVSQAYDERNSRLAPISENMHFLIRLILRDLPEKPKILCVGVGTGAEILSLAKAFPQADFVGVDPSLSMLEVCQERLNVAGISDRCQLIHGYVQDVVGGECFDAVLSILVAHFIKSEDRFSFFQSMTGRLKKNGYLINTEISFDLDSPEFSLILKNWEQVQVLMGATPESLANLPKQFREVLTVLPPTKTEELLLQSGVKSLVRFYQSFMIHGWWGQK